MALFLAVTLFFQTWKILTGLYGNIPGRRRLPQRYFRDRTLSFWGLEIGAGLIAPLVLLLAKKLVRQCFMPPSSR